MKYCKSEKYDVPAVNARIMGPHPVKLEEELLLNHRIPEGALVMDLGSGQGVTSVFLAKEYGFRVIAADLWSEPTDNLRFFREMGVGPERLLPLKADANALPFPQELFDAVVSVDSYHYFGRDPSFLGEKLLPFVKRGGLVYIAIPGMKKDCHHDLPKELLLSWTAEQLETMHDAVYWRAMVSRAEEAEILDVYEMESNDEVWRDWLACDNEYARGDRAAMEAGGGKYLNFIAIVLRRR